MKNGSSSNIHFCINNHLFIKYFFNWIKTTFLAFMRSIWWEPLDHSEQVNSHKESMYQNGRIYWKCPRICLPNLSAQLVCPSPKVLEFNEKRLHCNWASVVRVAEQCNIEYYWMKSFLKAYSSFNSTMKVRKSQKETILFSFLRNNLQILP